MATKLRLTKWVMARAARAIVTNTFAAVSVVLTSAVAAATFIAAANTTITQRRCPQHSHCSGCCHTHLFDTAIKQRWRGRWRRKRWLRRRGWRANNGNNGDGNGDKTRDGDSNDVAGYKEGDGESGKSNDDGNKEGNVDGGKGNGNGIEKGKGDGQRGQLQRRQEQWQRRRRGRR